MTLREELLDGTRFLEDNRISSSRLTAEVLLCHVLDCDRTYLYTHDDRVLSAEQIRRYRSLLQRRAEGEPVQYLRGRQEFWGREFEVEPSVLIPRPETELIVETILHLQSMPAPSIADVGTGSGCIAVSLAAEIQQATVFGFDISWRALTVARRNARKHGIQVHFACMDVMEAALLPFDFIACNPPYADPSERSSVQREVRDHEPEIAVFPPEEPLSVYRAVIPQAETRLKMGGYLVLEIGLGMESRVRALFGSGWQLLPTRTDLQGIPRTIVARRV